MVVAISALSAALVICAAVLGVVVVRLRQSRREVARLNDAMGCAAMIDEATGVLSRGALEAVGEMLVTLARRDSDAVSVCLVEVVPAEAAGLEDAMISAADAVRAVCRSGDAVGRVGPATLMLVGKGAGFPANALERRLLAALSMVHPPGSTPPHLALGIAGLPPWEAGDLASLEADALIDLEVRRVAAAAPGSDAA